MNASETLVSHFKRPWLGSVIEPGRVQISYPFAHLLSTTKKVLQSFGRSSGSQKICQIENGVCVRLYIIVSPVSRPRRATDSYVRPYCSLCFVSRDLTHFGPSSRAPALVSDPHQASRISFTDRMIYHTISRAVVDSLARSRDFL